MILDKAFDLIKHLSDKIPQRSEAIKEIKADKRRNKLLQKIQDDYVDGNLAPALAVIQINNIFKDMGIEERITAADLPVRG